MPESLALLEEKRKGTRRHRAVTTRAVSSRGVSLGCMASFSGSSFATSLSPDAAALLRCVGHRPSAAPTARKRSDAAAGPSSRCFRSASFDSLRSPFGQPLVVYLRFAPVLSRLLAGRALFAAVSVGVSCASRLEKRACCASVTNLDSLPPCALHSEKNPRAVARLLPRRCTSRRNTGKRAFCHEICKSVY